MNSLYPLVTLPKSVDLTLLLIREELKSRKFFNALEQLGLTDSPCQPHLDDAILSALNLDDDEDETFTWYSRIMEEHCQRITHQKDSATQQALEVYWKLKGRGSKLEV